MKLLISAFLLLHSMASFAINGKEFVDCFDKAMSERIQELKDQEPKLVICEQLSKRDRSRLYDLYSYMGSNGWTYFYSDEFMGEKSVRFHFDQIKWEVECYKNTNNIFTAWIKGFGNALGFFPYNNQQLIEESMSKILGRKMWGQNGSDQFSDHDFKYCSL